MSDNNGTCGYVFDPDDPETWNGEEREKCLVDEKRLNKNGLWNCPHDAEDGEELCIFHMPVEDKDDEIVADAFVDVLDEFNEQDDKNSENRRSQFLGARFGEFDLGDAPPEVVAEDTDIVLSHIIVEGRLDWSNATFEVSEINMRGVEFTEDSFFDDAEFGGDTSFHSAEFGGEASFHSAEFGRYADFSRVQFNQEFNFYSAEFGRYTDFGSAGFGGYAAFTHAEFDGASNFICVDFDGYANFDSAEFGGEARFNNAEFGQKANFHSADFGGKAEFQHTVFCGEATFLSAGFDGKTEFYYTEFGGKADFTHGEFSEETSFYNAEFSEESDFYSTVFSDWGSFGSVEFGGEVNFHSVEFENTLNLSEATFEEGPDFSSFESLSGGKFSGADLTDAAFTGVTLHDADFENTLLSRATLFGSDFRGAKLSGAVLGDVRIDEDTQFLGYPDDDGNRSPHTFSAIRSKPCCVYDPNYRKNSDARDVDKAKSVYQALEELAGKAARPRLQSQCFVRRQDLQKGGYKQAAKGADTLEERLIAGARYSRAKVARGTLLYGESPWRVIGGSILFIIFTALLYPLSELLQPVGGEPITYSRILDGELELILESLYFSTLTFTTLGMGDYEPIGFGQVIATINTTLGAVLIALLVFVLGRRAAR